MQKSRRIRPVRAEKNLTGTVEYGDACSLIQGDYDRIRQLFVILRSISASHLMPVAVVHMLEPVGAAEEMRAGAQVIAHLAFLEAVAHIR